MSTLIDRDSVFIPYSLIKPTLFHETLRNSLACFVWIIQKLPFWKRFCWLFWRATFSTKWRHNWVEGSISARWKKIHFFVQWFKKNVSCVETNTRLVGCKFFFSFANYYNNSMHVQSSISSFLFFFYFIVHCTLVTLPLIHDEIIWKKKQFLST